MNLTDAVVLAATTVDGSDLLGNAAASVTIA
jgi:hypothetical protein